MPNSLQSHGLQHARLPCAPPSPGVCSNSCPLSQWCHPTIASSAAPFSFCLQSFPASGPFLVSQLFTSGGQSFGEESTLNIHWQDWCWSSNALATDLHSGCYQFTFPPTVQEELLLKLFSPKRFFFTLLHTQILGEQFKRKSFSHRLALPLLCAWWRLSLFSLNISTSKHLVFAKVPI